MRVTKHGPPLFQPNYKHIPVMNTKATASKLFLTVIAMGTLLSAASGAGYLKLGDIKGESNDNHHKDWIEIASFSQAMHRPDMGEGATRRRGAAVMEDLKCVKELDKSSPLLARALLTGEVIPEAELELTRGEEKAVYLKIKLTNVLVTSYSVNGSAAGNEVPMEEVSFNYEKVEWTYTTYDASGRPSEEVSYSWKVEEGVSLREADELVILAREELREVK